MINDDVSGGMPTFGRRLLVAVISLPSFRCQQIRRSDFWVPPFSVPAKTVRTISSPKVNSCKVILNVRVDEM